MTVLSALDALVSCGAPLPRRIVRGIGAVAAVIALASPAQGSPLHLDVEFGWDWMEFGEGRSVLTLEDSWAVWTSGGELENTLVRLDWTGRTRRRTTHSGKSVYEFGPGLITVDFQVHERGAYRDVGTFKGRADPFSILIDERDLAVHDMSGTSGRGRPDEDLARFLGVSRRAGTFDFLFLLDIIDGLPGGEREGYSGCCGYFDASLTEVPEPGLLVLAGAGLALLLRARPRRPARDLPQ